MKSYFESKSPAQSKNSNSSNRGKKRHVLQSIPIIMICEVRFIRRYSHLLLHVMEWLIPGQLLSVKILTFVKVGLQYLIILGKIIRYLDLSRLSENQNSLYIAIIKNIRIQKNKKIDTKKTLLEIDVDKAKNAGDGSIMSIYLWLVWYIWHFQLFWY